MASSPSSKPRRKEQTVDKESKLTAKDKSSSLVVFAHGAGAPSTSDWMIRYAWWKRRAPPKAEKLVDFHSDIVKNAVSKYPGHPLILAGKSIGSRFHWRDGQPLITSIEQELLIRKGLLHSAEGKFQFLKWLK